MAVRQNVEAGDALGHEVLGVLDDLLVRTLKDARAAGHLADERQVVHSVVLQKLCNGVIVDRAHQVIKAAVDCGLSAVKAGRLIIGDDLEECGLAGCLHRAGERLHLILGQTYIFEAPVFYGLNILAFVKDFVRILDRYVMVRKHDDYIGSHN